MRVGVVAPAPVPPVRGGLERLTTGLVDAIAASGEHTAELVAVPSPETNLADLAGSYRRMAALDVSRFDLVVSTKYPSWMVEHPNHVLYLVHPLRGLYDTYPAHLHGRPVPDDEPTVRAVRAAVLAAAPAAELLDAVDAAVAALGAGHPDLALPGPLSRLVVHALDQTALAPDRVRRHLAISRTVAGRAGYLPPDVTARAVVPPSSLPAREPTGATHLFTTSRLDRPKRIDLLIDAMRHVPGSFPLIVAGAGPDADRLRRRARRDHRIRFVGEVDDDELTRLYAEAAAVGFVPRDEDLGLITLEAQGCAKPVVTTTDSGGPAELIRHGTDGLVVAPTPRAIGAAFARLLADPDRAAAMGEAGRRRSARFGWPAVVEAVVAGGPSTRRPAPRPTRPDRRVLVLSTYPAVPTRGGGQVRMAQLYGRLRERFDVTLLTLDDAGGAGGTTEIAPGFTQTVVEKSAAHRDVEDAMDRSVGVPIGDIAAAAAATSTPDLVDRARASGADVVVLAHPYLLPVAETALPDVPVVLDAHNAEIVLKDHILPRSPAGDRLRGIVRDVEARAWRTSRAVVTCSDDDLEVLRTLGPTPATLHRVPNGADVSGTRPVGAEERRRRSDRLRAASGRDEGAIALFVASAHAPNLDAAARIVEDLAPALPDVLFLLAGSQGRAIDRSALPSNVGIAGVVEPVVLRALLAAADVAVNPMRRGAGTNLKVVEAFAAGLPVVSTTVGARGLDVTDGVEALIADGPDDLAAAIRTTLDDPSAAAARAVAARRLAADRYDWATLARRFGDVVGSVAARGARPGAVPRRSGPEHVDH